MKSSITDLLHEALYDVMIEVVGWTFEDPDGYCERARERLAKYDGHRKNAYSARCIDAAKRQRETAHWFFKQARKMDAHLAPMGVKSIHWQDAKDSLRDAIRWINTAKAARVKERQADEMFSIRRERDEFRAAAE